MLGWIEFDYKCIKLYTVCRRKISDITDFINISDYRLSKFQTNTVSK